MSTETVTRTATAWESIGWDDGLFRIRGGRTTYEAVMFQDGTRQRKVKLAKLKPMERGVAEVSRYVDPDTVLEFLAADEPQLVPEPPQCEHSLRTDTVLGGQYCIKCHAHFATQNWP